MIYYIDVAGSKCPRCGYGTIKTDFLCNPCIRAVEDREEFDYSMLEERPEPPRGIEIKYGKDRQ